MDIRFILNLLIKFLFFYVVTILALMIIVNIVLSTSKNEKRINNKIGFYGMFMQLGDRSILNLSIIILRYFFIIFSLFNSISINRIHLFILLLLTLIYSISSLSLKNLFLGIFSSFGVYVGLFLTKILSNYLIDVYYLWYVYYGRILLVIFLIIYATFFFIKEINETVLNNKFIRRIRSES